MSIQETDLYTVVLEIPGDKIPDSLGKAVQNALETIENASATDPTKLSTLALNKKELLITTALSFPVAISANFATDAIKDALKKDPSTQSVVVKDVIPETEEKTNQSETDNCS